MKVDGFVSQAFLAEDIWSCRMKLGVTHSMLQFLVIDEAKFEALNLSESLECSYDSLTVVKWSNINNRLFYSLHSFFPVSREKNSVHI